MEVTKCPPGYAWGYMPQGSGYDFHEVEQDAFDARGERDSLREDQFYMTEWCPVNGRLMVKKRASK